jgi:hypothetical protein
MVQVFATRALIQRKIGNLMILKRGLFCLGETGHPEDNIAGYWAGSLNRNLVTFHLVVCAGSSILIFSSYMLAIDTPILMDRNQNFKLIMSFSEFSLPEDGRRWSLDPRLASSSLIKGSSGRISKKLQDDPPRQKQSYLLFFTTPSAISCSIISPTVSSKDLHPSPSSFLDLLDCQI